MAVKDYFRERQRKRQQTGAPRGGNPPIGRLLDF